MYGLLKHTFLNTLLLIKKMSVRKVLYVSVVYMRNGTFKLVSSSAYILRACQFVTSVYVFNIFFSFVNF